LHAQRTRLANHPDLPEVDFAAKLQPYLHEFHIHFEYQADGLPATFLNNENVETAIRQMEISQMVSPVSALKPVRIAMVKQQQRMGEKKGIVMDGRDIGTTVFPDAELKIFMTAQKEVRAKRRFDELNEKGFMVNMDEIIRNIAERDYTDTNRKESPLRQAADAIVLDNSAMNQQEQLEFAQALVQRITSIKSEV